MTTMHILATSRRLPWILVTVLACAMFTIWVLPATAQKSKKSQPTQSTVREILSQFEGKSTNMGTLAKVTGDYFSTEDEGVTTIHPLTTIHSLVLTKDEETLSTKLEIKLLAKE